MAVVTGAASGIGRALSAELRRRGCDLALVDTDRGGLEAVQRQLGAEATAGVSIHVADVGDRKRVAELPEEVEAVHGGAQLLINSAGVAYEGAFVRNSLDAWQQVLSANLWGTIHCCHFFLPLLARSPRGHIVNLSSLLGSVAMPGQTAYCASKFAVRGLSEALAEELRPTNVGLTLVHPGAVATNIMKTAAGDDPELLSRIDEWLPPRRAYVRARSQNARFGFLGVSGAAEWSARWRATRVMAKRNNPRSSTARASRTRRAGDPRATAQRRRAPPAVHPRPRRAG